MMVSTLNGKITNGDDPHIGLWTSVEDKNHFLKIIEHAKVIVMGSKTYEAAKNTMQHREGRIRIVVTSHPDRFNDDKKEGILEFTSENPEALMSRLKSLHHEEVLLLGGGELNASFLKAGLVDEIKLTLEPVLFGKGRQLVAEEDFSSSFELVSSEKLNDKGTLLLCYKVLKLGA